MQSLRVFLSIPHQRGLERTGLLDREVQYPLLQERLQRIRTQVTAALVLHGVLTEMGCPVSHMVDLLPLIEQAVISGIISEKAAGILQTSNREANEAKHLFVFRARI